MELTKLYELKAIKNPTKTQVKKIVEMETTIYTALRTITLLDLEMQNMINMKNAKYGMSLGTELKLDCLRLIRTMGLNQ